MRRALIIGINGQDGSYLAEHLLAEGYEVYGTIRRSSLPNLSRLSRCLDHVELYQADLSDSTSIANAVQAARPDEVYNLGAMPDVQISFDLPEYSGDVTGLGAVRVLDAVARFSPDAKYYQAGSSEMFGMNPVVPTNETSAFEPASPYAIAKVYAHQMTANYRRARGMFACNGILFNHESERRGAAFVTRKITLGIADIMLHGATELVLGNLEAKRDWGHARDYVRAMHLMLQADEPGDYVVATGETHSVREFLDYAFRLVALDYEDWVRTGEEYLRPIDPPVLIGDASKARAELGWKPEIGFEALVELMVDADLAAA